MAQDALTAQAEIARLKFQLARYRRAEFGRSSEKLARDTEQLELALETLETDQAERLATASPAVVAAVETAAEAQKPARRPLPEHLPREVLSLLPRNLLHAHGQIFWRSYEPSLSIDKSRMAAARRSCCNDGHLGNYGFDGRSTCTSGGAGQPTDRQLPRYRRAPPPLSRAR